MDVFDVIRKDPRIDALCRRLNERRGAVSADGLWGSSAPILAAVVAERLGRPMLVITAHVDEADDCRDDLEAVMGWAPELLPAPETLPGETTVPDDAEGERLRLCLLLGMAAGTHERNATGQPHGPGGADCRSPVLIVAPIQALMRPVPSPAAIRARSFQLAVGMQLDPEDLVRWLAARGFQRCDQVEVPGDFSKRGGIVDVYALGHTDAVRVEFFGDEVESIRLFDAGSQRSSRELHETQLPAIGTTARDGGSRPAHGTAPVEEETTGFLAYLPADAVIAFHEPGEIQEIGRTLWQRLGERTGLITADAVFRRAADFSQLYLERFAGGAAEHVAFGVGGLPPFEAKAAEALVTLRALARTAEVVVFCDNAPEEERFAELLAAEHARVASQEPQADAATAEADTARDGAASGRQAGERGPAGHGAADAGALGAGIRTTVGVIHRGFVWTPPVPGGAETAPAARGTQRSAAAIPRAFVPHHELFHRYRQRRTLRRVQPARPIDDFFDLNAGDHVVHATHGIGRFIGLKSIERAGRVEEYIAIEFADKAVVHVSVSQIHLVQKYIGSFRGRPKLSTLGGTAWKKTKARVAEAVTDMAADLLAIQAQRATQEGIAYPHDTQWQREFEGSFIYEETVDQLAALDQVKADMSRPRPMDRLLCGDVGFGKTEIAIRAAFKTIEFGKQVAVLVPTTVLAEQHFQTFRERLADYPFTIEALSRFRTKIEQTRIIERAKRGAVDILIGTHRLISKDVGFADLGLVIVDEEQRFGVEAKERLKRMRTTVDLLTLSATPIPRTLHMAMLGIRDISSLATPPLDRRSIVTQVRMWDDRLIREAVLRELNREGQVYFVHNFVRDIAAVANHVRAIVPEARVVVGHGQMAGHELEEVMLKFLDRAADVLVSTNIIESGLDIPSANTIFISRADRFGLAELHQLRGRVGRSKHRAYAYLLLSPKHPVKDTAARRLKAVEQYSELGAGFQIAMRDLEIRGAGNILGSEQSGHIEAVGYEMYCQLLEQAVRRMRNEPAHEFRPVNLDLGISASIPRGYIRADRQRMEVYKRLTNCRSGEQIDALRRDLRDAFGPPPEAVETLLALAEVRVLAAPWGVRSIVIDPPDVVFAIDDLEKVQPLFAEGPGSPRVPDPKTVHWRLPKGLLEPGRLVVVLRDQLAGGSGRTVRSEARA